MKNQSSIMKWLFIVNGAALVLLSLMSFSLEPDSGGSFVNSGFLAFPFFSLGIGSATTDILFLALYIVQGILLIYMGWKKWPPIKRWSQKWFPNKVIFTSALFYSIWLGIAILSVLTTFILSRVNPTSDWGQTFLLFVFPLYLAQIIAFISFWIGLVIEVARRMSLQR